MNLKDISAAGEPGGAPKHERLRKPLLAEIGSGRLKSGLDAFALVIPETRTGFYPSIQRGFS